MRNCPAREKKCNMCRRMNHFSRVYMTKSSHDCNYDQGNIERPKRLGRIVRSPINVNKRRMVNIQLNGKVIPVVDDICVLPNAYR